VELPIKALICSVSVVNKMEAEAVAFLMVALPLPKKNQPLLHPGINTKDD